MKRGPAPTPTALRIIQGNPGKRPLNKNEPKPRPSRPPCPKILQGEGRKVWRRIVPELDRLGLLTIVDRESLLAYCHEWARYVEATAAIVKYGPILKSKDSDYFQISPYITIANKALQQVRAFASEFGLTPAARSRMSVPRGDGNDDSWGGVLE